MRQKKIIKQRVKCKEETTRLRKLILFVERTREDGVRFMCDKLTREVVAATATAHRIFDPKDNNTRRLQIKKYLTDSNIPLKKKQMKELEFLLT